MIKAAVQRALNRMGYEVYRLSTQFSPAELEAMRRVAPFTATSKSRMIGLMDAVRYNERPDVKAQLELEIDGAVDQRHLEDLLAQRALVRQGMDAATVEQLRQQMERAMARRIHPHYVHDFFLEAFRRLGGKVNPREKGRYEITYVPPLLLDRNQQIGIGQIGRAHV